jgi:hypothetical protein
MKLLLPGFLILLIVSCSTESHKYSPSRQFSPKEQEALVWIMMRYLGKAPEGVSAQEKFSPNYDSSYLRQSELITLEAWQKKGDTCFFMVSRRAPSLVDKRVATGGKLVFSDDGELISYAEVFRTWKMVPDTLSKRSLLLFDKMVMGESLKPFETRYSDGIEYIEFPDESTYYDKEAREWKIKSSN